MINFIVNTLAEQINIFPIIFLQIFKPWYSKSFFIYQLNSIFLLILSLFYILLESYHTKPPADLNCLSLFMQQIYLILLDFWFTDHQLSEYMLILHEELQWIKFLITIYWVCFWKCNLSFFFTFFKMVFLII